MRLLVYSDLHLEFAPFEPSRDADVVVLAGDIDVKGRGLAFARRFACPVIYVAGNHEFYGSAAPRMVEKLKLAAQGTQVHVLDCEAAFIDGVRFLGATMWTDFVGDGSLDATVAMEKARAAMSDYRKIRVSPSFKKLGPHDTRKWHAKARAWLSGQLATPHDGPTVVVTHHAPTLRGCSAADRQSGLLGAYATDLESLMRPGISAWIFGHSHFAFDERINGTRVVSNPRGYPGEWVASFERQCIISV